MEKNEGQQDFFDMKAFFDVSISSKKSLKIIIKESTTYFLFTHQKVQMFSKENRKKAEDQLITVLKNWIDYAKKLINQDPQLRFKEIPASIFSLAACYEANRQVEPYDYVIFQVLLKAYRIYDSMKMIEKHPEYQKVNADLKQNWLVAEYLQDLKLVGLIRKYSVPKNRLETTFNQEQIHKFIKKRFK